MSLAEEERNESRWRLPAGSFALLTLGILPNVILALAAAAMHGQRALVDVDYLVIAAFDAFLTRAMITLLLGAALAFDVAFTFAPTFNFGPAEVLAAVEQVHNFSGRAIAFAIAVVLVVLLIAIGLVALRGPRTRASDRVRLPLMCAAVFAVVYLADILNGSDTILWRPRPFFSIDVATSVVAGQYAGEIRQPIATRDSLPGATTALRTAVAAVRDREWSGPAKIVLVMVESLGEPKGAELSRMFAMFTSPQLSARYSIQTGSVEFFGGTTSGELRELCGARMNHIAFLRRPLDSCLPARFRRLGFETVALHGYNGALFQRLEWYPRVGFDRILFQSDLEANTPLPECGMLFHGVCDSTMIAILRRELTRDPRARQFVYWMTLSAHFPIDPRNGGDDPACSALGPVGRERSVCAWWHATQPALRGIAALAADSTMPPALYILVGDHSPPPLLSGPRLFVPDRVPYVTLRPNG